MDDSCTTVVGAAGAIGQSEGDVRVESRRSHFTVDFSYAVHFTRGFCDRQNPVLERCLRAGGLVQTKAPTRVLAVLDSGVARCWPGLLDGLAKRLSGLVGIDFVGGIEVPGGEACKQGLAEVERVHAVLARKGLDRHARVMAIGGGAVLDMVGFAVATAHRGIGLVRVPTTVLAQNDSGVGVKNGVNGHQQKNFIGTFAPPQAVVCDFDFLSTLDPRDARAGLAEAVKVAAIRDPEFFAWLEGNAPGLAAFAPAPLEISVRRAAELHMQHIAQSGDPFESGSARPLDYGHWAAHKLEIETDHQLRHGEAVAIGLAIDARYAVELGLCPPAVGQRIVALLRALGFCLEHPVVDRRDAAGQRVLWAGLDEFRQHLGGELSLTMLRDFGDAVQVDSVDADAMERALQPAVGV